MRRGKDSDDRNGTGLSAIGADASVVDAARSIRIPGSINTDAPAATREVKFWPQLDARGMMPVYALGEMAQFFGVTYAPRSYTKSAGTGNRSGYRR